MANQIDSKKTVFLIDGSTFLYRAYYGMRPLHTSKGLAVQAVYTFCRMIKSLINKFEPHHMALVWDSPGKTERHEVYQDYKAGRQAPPSDLFEQKEYIVKFANLIGLNQLQRSGVEADDIIASLAKDYKEHGYNVVIIASDKDLQQLLDEQILVYDPFKDAMINRQAFIEKMGFEVEKLPFYFALLGDASDNIPGVRGIGKKGAEDLVKQFDSLQDLYNNLDKVSSNRARTALQENKENAFLSLNLFLTRYHKLDVDLDNLAFNKENWANALPLFEELEFKSMVKEIGLPEKEKEEEPFFGDVKNYKFECITTKEQLDKLSKDLKEAKFFAVDTETDGLDYTESKLVGLSFCFALGSAYYIPFRHQTAETQLTFEEVKTALKPLLEDENLKKCLHNAKYDRHVLHRSGIELKGVSDDTMISGNLVTQDWQRIGLKHLSQFYFNERMLTFDDVVKSKKLKDFSFVNLEEATKYSAGDAHQTLKLNELFKEKLKEENLENLYRNIEMPLSDILYQMELEGIFINQNELKVIDEKVTRVIKLIEEEIQTLTGLDSSLNLNSPKQIEDLLFRQLNLPTQKKSAKRTGYSTDQEVLEILAEMHPVPRLILKYRELYKLKSTYIDALPTYVDQSTGKIHTTFSQVSTATGRLSSFDPNLQNIPTDSYGIRSVFKPNESHVFLSADYSQIELRVLAYLSQDESLVKAFLAGEDIHARTASKLFDVSIDEVTTEQRQIGKRINFSIMYGLTPFGLAKDLKIPFSEAKQYIEKYFEQYPGVSAWMEKTIQEAKEKGYVQTYWGRRRYVPGIYEKNKTLYDLARRIVINTPAQGTASEIMKIGMIELNKIFKTENLKSKPILQIHDELLISVPKDEQDLAEILTKKALEKVVNWNVPLLVTTRFGANWQEVTK